jgi:hypothetical protein
MDIDVPYMGSIRNVPAILDAVQRAAVPDAFGLDFLRDLGFTSSNDRPIIRVLKYLGMLDGSGRPQTPYRDFVDHTRSKTVLAARLRIAYDDLFTADRQAHTKGTAELKGWFKTKTGAGDAVAEKMASTFKALATYANFSPSAASPPANVAAPVAREEAESRSAAQAGRPGTTMPTEGWGLVYRIEIHLPDTSNVETYRAIFRAIREELAS